MTIKFLEKISFPERKRIIVALLVWLGYTIIANLQYLPGPDGLRHFAGIAHFFSELFRVFIFLLPLVLVMLMVEIFKRKRITIYSIAVSLLSLSSSANHYLIAPAFQFVAGEYTMRESESLVRAIEEFKSETGKYPDSLTQLSPVYMREVRDPLVMGIDRYYWGNKDSLFFLNFDMETSPFRYRCFVYRPDTSSNSDFKNTELHATTRSDWMYYEYDF